MKRKKHSHFQLSHKLALSLSINLSLLFASFVFIGSVFSRYNGHTYEITQTTAIHSIMRFLANVCTLFLLYEFCFWVFRKKWTHRKHFFIGLFGTLCVAMLVSPLVSKIIFDFTKTNQNDLQNNYIVLNLIKDLVLALIVFLSTLSITVILRNQQTKFENQQLSVENIRNRYEALKNQLNPHFLFNSLNTLDGLIGFDDEKAHTYLQGLSSSFRYTIQNKEFTTLEDELLFVKSYSYMMKIRYGDNLNILYTIDEKYNLYYIMPVSLQLLMENAIKHNIINDKYPLTIHIETTEENTIKVSNPIQPKIDTEAGEGIGLANLIERYKLLFNMDIIITQNGFFAVEVPLIKEINDNTFLNKQI